MNKQDRTFDGKVDEDGKNEVAKSQGKEAVKVHPVGTCPRPPEERPLCSSLLWLMCWTELQSSLVGSNEPILPWMHRP